jgi:predicted amidohydrolase
MSHFTNGAIDKVRLVEIDGLKVGVLICFEIRFTKLWERLKGADVILVPALWGKPRKEHLETLAKALALTNQCFVVVSNSSSSEYAKSSSIITPFGKIYKDDRKEVVTHQIDLKEIKKMKHYIRLHH